MIRVAVVYLVVGWAIVEATSVLFPALLLPDWTQRLVVILALLGFPAAVILAWAFDVTPNGLKVTERADVPAPTPTEQADESPENSERERLDGWKRIASALNRDVRTVRRWEKEQGLPVHRVQHRKGATVYCYRDEIEAWLVSRDLPSQKPVSTTRDSSRFPHSVLAYGVAGIVLLAAIAAYFWLPRPAPAIQFGDRDWVLVTSFDNKTGEAVLDGTLENALQRELNNSHSIKVIARNRINDTLKLMKLPTETVIDVEIGREISLRDGAVRILLHGIVTRLGNLYSLSVDLINAADGVTLRSLEAVADGQSEILPAIAGLARETRRALGDELVASTPQNEQLDPVTTPSLPALKLFSQADALMSSGSQRHRARPLLEQALVADPDFAAAHLLLYYLYMDLDSRDKAQEHLARARELAQNVSERERLFIIATDHASRPAEIERSIEIAGVLADLYPDHFWAVSNLASLNQALGRYSRAYPWRLRRADLRPNEGWSNLEAVFAATVFQDWETREPYLARVDSLSSGNRWLANRRALLPFYEAWLKADLSVAANQLDTLVSQWSSTQLDADPELALIARSGYLTMGLLDRYRQLLPADGAPDWLDAIVQFDSGNVARLEDYLDHARGHMWDAALAALAGRIEDARHMIEEPLARGSTPWPYFRPNFKYLAKGELALAAGRPEEAIAELENALHLFNFYSIAHYLFGMNTLARAQSTTGDTAAAIETLESRALERDWSIFEPGATYMWQRNQRLLAELYLQTGEEDRARKVLDELSAMKAE